MSQEGQGARVSLLAKGTSLKINILRSHDRKLYKIKRGCQEVQAVRLFSFPSVFFLLITYIYNFKKQNISPFLLLETQILKLKKKKVTKKELGYYFLYDKWHLSP